MSSLNRFACDNCGFWQESFAAPLSCPICTDFRHTPPPRPFRFFAPSQAARRLSSTWAEVLPGVWEIRAEPSFGIGTVGYLIEHEAGNVLWDGAALYSPEALAFIESRGGVRWLSASHPHAYGAAWQVQERFAPTVALQVLDLPWASTLRVAHPFDEALELAPGLEIRRTGGHFEGHSVLHWRERGLLFAGDMVKFHFDRWPVGLSCHKAFNRQVPLSHAELRLYREALRGLDFHTVLTSFDRGACTRDDILALLEARLAGAPSCEPVDLHIAPSAAPST